MKADVFGLVLAWNNIEKWNLWKLKKTTNPDLKLYLDETSAKIERKCEKIKKSVSTKEQKDTDLWEAGSRCAKIARTNEWRQRTETRFAQMMKPTSNMSVVLRNAH